MYKLTKNYLETPDLGAQLSGNLVVERFTKRVIVGNCGVDTYRIRVKDERNEYEIDFGYKKLGCDYEPQARRDDVFEKFIQSIREMSRECIKH